MAFRQVHNIKLKSLRRKHDADIVKQELMESIDTFDRRRPTYRRDSDDGSSCDSNLQRRSLQKEKEEVFDLPLKPSSDQIHEQYRRQSTIHFSGQLSPRSDVWLIVSLSAATSLGSLAVATDGELRNTSEVTVLATNSLIFTISIIIGCGYRYTPMRENISNGCVTRWSKETMLSMLTLVLVIVSVSIAMNPVLSIAVSGNQVWNANLFYACWIGYYSCLYLVGDLISVPGARRQDRKMPLMHNAKYADSCDINATAKIWFMVLGSAISLSVVLIDLYSSSVCASPLDASPMCMRAITSGLLAIIVSVITLTALVAHRILRNTHENSAALNCFNGDGRAVKASRTIGSILSIAALLITSTMVGLISSPSGPGCETGSIFITAWMTFGLCLVTFKRYMESLFMSHPAQSSCESFHLPMKHVLLHDDSSSKETTALDDSYKVTDDESEAIHQENDNDEEGQLSSMDLTMPPTQMNGHFAPMNSSRGEGTRDSAMSFQSPNKSSKAQRNSRGSVSEGSDKMTKSTFSSNSAPFVFTSSHTDVSTLGVTSKQSQDPLGVKLGDSFNAKNHASKNVNAPNQARLQRQSSSHYNLPISNHYDIMSDVPTNTGIDKNEPSAQKPNRRFQRRLSNSSFVSSLPRVQECSHEGTFSSKSDDYSSQNRQDKASRTSNSTSKKSKSLKASKASGRRITKHQLPYRGSEGSSTGSEPKTLEEGEKKIGRDHRIYHSTSPTLHASDLSVFVSDGNTTVTELTTDSFEGKSFTRAPRTSLSTQPTRHVLPAGLPQRNPLYNCNDSSQASGNVTPRLNPHDISVDELVATALRYARISRNVSDSYGVSSEKTSGLQRKGHRRPARNEPKLNGVNNIGVNNNSVRKSQNSGKSRSSSSYKYGCDESSFDATYSISPALNSTRRGSLQSMYSESEMNDENIGIDFAC